MMRSSDLFFGLFAAMAGFAVVVALAAGLGTGVIVVLVASGLVALALMRSRAERAPQVLLVGRSTGEIDHLESALDLGDFAVARCAGPQARSCPVLEGRPCPVPAHPLATVTYLDAPEAPLPPCERHFHVPVIAVEAANGRRRPGAARQMRMEDGTPQMLAVLRELTS
jgi:hypothetical protein